MIPAAHFLKQRAHWTERPAHYEALLLEPICVESNQNLTSGGCYVRWEQDHWLTKRFYVAGMQWFIANTQIGQGPLVNLRLDVQALVNEGGVWNDPAVPAAYWGKEFGRPQVLEAWGKHPISFSSAAKVLLCCELAVAAMLKQRDTVGGLTSAGQIYSRMGIVPAVWNIIGFGKEYVEEARALDNNFEGNLFRNAQLVRVDLIKQLAPLKGDGGTVTRDTADKIREHAPTVRVNVLGEVRAWPGSHIGAGIACDAEEVDVG